MGWPLFWAAFHYRTFTLVRAASHSGNRRAFDVATEVPRNRSANGGLEGAVNNGRSAVAYQHIHQRAGRLIPQNLALERQANQRRHTSGKGMGLARAAVPGRLGAVTVAS